MSVFYAAGPPEAQLCGASRVGVVGGGNSAGQAAVWLARGGALVTLLHRRADLRETMSDYLVRDLERYGVAVRDRSEIAELHGTDGQLEAVTLRDGERLPFSFLFLFLGAQPCTEWLDDSVARDEDGFILTGVAAERGQPARDERPRRLRGRRRPLRLDQALRHSGRRRSDGRAVRPRAPRQPSAHAVGGACLTLVCRRGAERSAGVATAAARRQLPPARSAAGEPALGEQMELLRHAPHDHDARGGGGEVDDQSKGHDRDRRRRREGREQEEVLLIPSMMALHPNGRHRQRR